MKEKDWTRISELFRDLADETPGYRADFLDMVCEGQPDLRSELEQLLAANDALQASDGESRNKGVTGPQTLPRQLGHYELTEVLGRGAMGSVYAAEHPETGPCALKVLPRLAMADEIARQRFEREAQVLAALDHPSICRLLDYFVTDDEAVLVMQRVEGVDLETRRLDGPMDYRGALDVLIQLSDALAHAHAKEVVHRDIKPSNIMMTREGGAILVDFGIARLADARLTATAQVIGSPRYMSPERWRGETAGTASDLWSLGVLAVELLAPGDAYPADNLSEIADSIINGPAPELPSHSVDGARLTDMSRLVTALQSKDPTIRMADAGRLTEELRGLLQKL